MRELNQKETDDITEYAGLLFSPEEIVIILQLDPAEFCGARLQQSDFNQAYMRGKLKKEAELRKAILDLAANGSSPAQILAMQMLDKIDLKKIDV